MRLIRRFAALFRKELLQLLKNKKMRIIVIAPPVIQLMLLGYAATMDLKECPFAVLDRARTAETRMIAASFANSSVFVRRADFTDEAEMRRRMSEKDVKLAVVFPTDFTHSRQIELVADGRNTSSAGLALGYANEIIARATAPRGRADGADVVFRGWFNPDFNAQWFMIPSLLAILILIVLTLLVALSLAKEREAGTMDQLRLTPYSRFEIMLAKGTSGMMIGIVQALLALTVTLHWFKVPFTGSPGALAVLLLSFLSSAVGIGLLVSVYCVNLQQAMIFTIVIAAPLAMLSGMATPVACMPDVLQAAMVFNPVRWAIDSLQRLFLEGAGFREVLPSVAILFGIGLAAFGAAWLKFRRA